MQPEMIRQRGLHDHQPKIGRPKRRHKAHRRFRVNGPRKVRSAGARKKVGCHHLSTCDTSPECGARRRASNVIGIRATHAVIANLRRHVDTTQASKRTTSNTRGDDASRTQSQDEHLPNKAAIGSTQRACNRQKNVQPVSAFPTRMIPRVRSVNGSMVCMLKKVVVIQR